MSDGPPAPALDDPPLASSSSSSSSTSSDDEARSADGRDDPSASRPSVNSSENTAGSRAAYKRHSKLLELLNAYDSLVYMELAALYYLDTSTILIILRTLVHLTQISHARTLALARASRLNLKPARINIFLVLSTNILAILVHIFMAPAEGSEATRGYLHGHLVVDLIGQKAIEGWLGKAKLCLMDCLIALLQIVAVGIVSEADRAEGTLEKAKQRAGSTRHSNGGGNPGASEVRNAGARDQGLGLFGFPAGLQQNANNEVNNDIELQDLSPARTRTDSEGQGLMSGHEDESRIGYDMEDAESASQALESFASGQVFLLHLRILDLLRDHFWEWRNRRLAGRV